MDHKYVSAQMLELSTARKKKSELLKKTKDKIFDLIEGDEPMKGGQGKKAFKLVDGPRSIKWVL